MNSRNQSDEERRAAINRALRKNESAFARWTGRIRRVSSYPPGSGSDVKGYRHGIGLIAVAIFVLLLTGLFLPRDNGRWMFGVFGFVLALVGAWKVDKARKS